MKTTENGTSDDSVEADIRRLGEIANALDAQRISAEASALAERVTEGRFYVACIGQFKRGKSTLLNALVGHAILPSAIVPVTAVPTILRFGALLEARVQFKTGRPVTIAVGEIEEYVSEEHNPFNAKNVEFVEVFVPSRLLQNGMCLVDTPGIGSVFANNTATTRAFIPHIDAAIAVVGADPPISGDELSLIEEVARSTPHVLFVLNKADRFTRDECAQAVAFTRLSLARRLDSKTWPVYSVSATEQLLKGGKGEDEGRDWTALVTALRTLAADGAWQIVREAATRGAGRLADECQREITGAIVALREPFEESDRRLARFQSYITRVEYELPRLDAMIGIEREGVSERLSRRREEFLAAVAPTAKLELAERIPALMDGHAVAFRDAAFALARQIAEERLKPWLGAEERVAEDLYREATRRFTELAASLLVELGGDLTGDDVVGPTALKLGALAFETVRGFTEGSRFYFHDVESLVRSASPWTGVVDAIRPRRVVRRDVTARATWYLTQLLDINSTRVRNDLDERMIESGRRLAGEICRLLQDILASAERSLARARAAHADGAASVARALERLAHLETEIRAVRLRNSAVTAHSNADQ